MAAVFMMSPISELYCFCHFDERATLRQEVLVIGSVIESHISSVSMTATDFRSYPVHRVSFGFA